MKLFGTTISLPVTPIPADSRQKPDPIPACDNEKRVCRQETHKQPEASVPGVKEEPAGPNCSSGVKSGKDENQTSIEDNRSAVDPNLEEEQMETDAASGEQKVLKKIDKIIPCPRCNSMDTKFCYYNNYNVNQPRHFCRSCHRYWTAGGAMRNVPVGAGRRKNKHLVPHYHRIVMPSDGMPAAHVEVPHLASHQVLPCRLSDAPVPSKGNGTVLNFGPDVSLYEPIGAVLNLGDEKKKIEQGSVSCVGNGDEPSCGSTVTASSCLENELPKMGGWMEQEACCSGYPPLHLQYYPGQPWSYPWSSGWNNVAAMTPGRWSSELVYEPENGNSGLVQWNSSPMVAAPPFCAPSIPFPFLPTSYWGSMPGGAGRSWDVPWGPSKCSRPLSSSTSNSVCSGNGSPTLGKHSRDETLKDEEKTEVSAGSQDAENYDPDESAKSFIWAAALGTKLEPATQGIYEAFHPKMEAKGHILNEKQVLQANPAALARSQMFQERM
ncbi:hypothetical protein AAC387_Pa02g4822 [Persea americana]